MTGTGARLYVGFLKIIFVFWYAAQFLVLTLYMVGIEGLG